MTDLCVAVLGVHARKFTAVLGSRNVWVTVLQESSSPETSPIVFCQDGKPRIEVVAEFWLSWDSASTYLRAERSNIRVMPFGKGEAMWRYDYLRNAEWKPVSYLHVHAHRDEAVHLMLTGTNQRSKRRLSQDNFRSGLSDLHFPLGGDRFRPCLEDVLEMLIQEFGVDSAPGALEAIQINRQAWRTKQVGAAVRDHPESAAASLRELGYSVEAPGGGPVEPRVEYLQRY